MAMKRKAIERCPPPSFPTRKVKAAGTPTRTSSNGSKTSERRTYVEPVRDTADNPTHRHHDQNGNIAPLHIIPGST